MARIVKVEIGQFDYLVVGEFKFFKPGPDGKSCRSSILIRLTDDEGRLGWGQACPAHTWSYETIETVESTLRGYLADAILGGDPDDMDDLHGRMDSAIRPAFSVGQPLCKAGIDTACFDLAGKRAGKSVSDLLGGSKREAIRLSWTVASPDMPVVEQQLREGRARGYENFNIKVGAPQSLEYDLELTKRVRAFAPEGFLWADANTGYSVEDALQIAPKLANAGADILESPLPPTMFRGYQQIKNQGALPIVMDEGILSPQIVEEFIALEMVDGITLKPARCAGIHPCRRIIETVKENGLMLLGSGLTDPDISLAAAVHVYGWAGIDYPCALNGPQYLADALCGNDLTPENGAVEVPNEPGLGIQLDARAEAVLEVVAEE